MLEEELIDIVERIEHLMDELDRWMRARETAAQNAENRTEMHRWRRRRLRLTAHRQGLVVLLTGDDDQ